MTGSVISRKQRPHENEAEAVEHSMVEVQVNQMGSDEAPPLTRRQGRPVVAKRFAAGISGEHRQNQQGTYDQQRQAPFAVAIERREQAPETPANPVHRSTRSHLL
jgi:hypothetical protein